MLMDGLPYPNDLVLNPAQNVLYVGVSRSLQVLRLPLSEGRVRKAGVFQQLSGGLGGPDGMAVCSDGSLLVSARGRQATPWCAERCRIRSRRAVSASCGRTPRGACAWCRRCSTC